MTANDTAAEGRSGHRLRSILPRQKQRKTGFAFLLQLYRQDPKFRGFLDFALIGSLVFAFLHPPALPDLRALFASSLQSVVASATAPPSLGDLLKESRDRAPIAPGPNDVEIDSRLFASSPHEEQRRLNRAVTAHQAGRPAEALEILNRSNLDDPNVLLVRGLAMLALAGFENLEAGIAFLDRAAAMGQRQAKVYRGLLLIMGPASVARDPERGLTLLRQAADRGDTVAARLIGTSYHRGWGGIVDQGLAVEYMRKAVAGGDPEAHVALSYFVLNGLGVPKDEAEGRRLITRAAELGDPEGQAVLGAFYFMQFIGGWMPDPSEAIRWLGRAAERGDVNAMEWLGKIYLQFGKAPPWLDPPRGVALFERCAALWHGPCLYGLATALDLGQGVARDPARAHAYYSLALQLGLTNAKQRIEALEPSLTPEQYERAWRLRETLAYRRLTGDPNAEPPVNN